MAHQQDTGPKLIKVNSASFFHFTANPQNAPAAPRRLQPTPVADVPAGNFAVSANTPPPAEIASQLTAEQQTQFAARLATRL